jgi:uncharacterized membrane protein
MAAGSSGDRKAGMMKKAAGKKSVKTSWGLRSILHGFFEIGIILKGIDGAFEIAGGLLLLAVSPEQINRILLSLLQHELSEDPRDVVANFLIRIAGHLSVKTQLFASLYLLSHGIVKIGLVVSLWKNRLWAYPAAIFFFGAFIVYQIYRYAVGHALWLAVLTAFDILVVALTWLEYSRLKSGK